MTTTSTATPWTRAATPLGGSGASGVRAGAELGPLGRRGRSAQQLLELQEIVFGVDLPARVGHEIEDAPIRVADHYLGDPAPQLGRIVLLPAPLYSVHALPPVNPSGPYGRCGLSSRGTPPSCAARRTRTPRAAWVGKRPRLRYRTR